MRRLLLLILFAASGWMIPQEARALGKNSVGTAGAQFLKLGTNARAVAMGEAYSAVTDGSDSLYWNPAGLERVDRKAFSVLHAMYLQNISYNYASYAFRFRESGVIAVGAQYLSAGSIDRTDRFGSAAGTYNPYDLAFSVGWARMFSDLGNDEEFAFGVTGKFIQSKVVETAATGAGDLGVLWTPSMAEDVTFGLSAQNIGGQLKFVNEGDALPMSIRSGASYIPMQDWIVSADVVFPNDAPIYASLGTEYKISLTGNITAAGRAGYKSKTSSDISGISSISAGTGLLWKGYGLDFSWQPFGVLGNTYLLSLSGKF